MPATSHAIGVPLSVAVGTDRIETVFFGGVPIVGAGVAAAIRHAPLPEPPIRVESHEIV